MMSNFLQQALLKTIVSCLDNGNFLIVDNSYSNTSTPKTVIGNIAETFVQGVAGQQIIIKGITIAAEGDAGISTLERENGTQIILLPLYQSKNANGTTSSSLNIVLDDGESVIIRTVGRGVAEETFFGVSYLTISC